MATSETNTRHTEIINTTKYGSGESAVKAVCPLSELKLDLAAKTGIAVVMHIHISIPFATA